MESGKLLESRLETNGLPAILHSQKMATSSYTVAFLDDAGSVSVVSEASLSDLNHCLMERTGE